jgi:CRP/FNR family nitrogen fixation transcriptional regulator
MSRAPPIWPNPPETFSFPVRRVVIPPSGIALRDIIGIFGAGLGGYQCSGNRRSRAMLTQTPTISRAASFKHPAAAFRHAPPAAKAPRADAIELMGALMPFARNSEIYGENEPADYLYKVVSGTVRTYKVLVDGRRQIGGFHLPGDMFGFESGDEHTFSAEAITDCKILVIKRSAVIALATRDNDVAQQMWALTARELQRVQDHIMVLIKSAQERVASFLLEMAGRAAGGGAVELPMSRQDIADYLGLTIETVSRTLTQLEKTAAIELPTSRRIVLRNRSALSRLNA